MHTSSEVLLYIEGVSIYCCQICVVKTSSGGPCVVRWGWNILKACCVVCCVATVKCCAVCSEVVAIHGSKWKWFGPIGSSSLLAQLCVEWSGHIWLHSCECRWVYN